MNADIDPEMILSECDERYYLAEQTPERTIIDIYNEHDGPVTITLDIGTFTVEGIDPGGGVKVSSNDEQFIKYYNATKFWPYGENIMDEEIENSRFENNPVIAHAAVDHWLAASGTVDIHA